MRVSEASRKKGGHPNLVRQDRLQAATEVAEVVSILMHLYSLSIILDL